jgi:hypothetical protein
MATTPPYIAPSEPYPNVYTHTTHTWGIVDEHNKPIDPTINIEELDEELDISPYQVH